MAEECAANGYNGDVHLQPGGRIVTTGGDYRRLKSLDVVTRDVTPLNGSGAYGNSNARGLEGGSSRPGGRR